MATAERKTKMTRVAVSVRTGQRRPAAYPAAFYTEDGGRTYFYPRGATGDESYRIVPVAGEAGRQFNTEPTVGKRILFMAVGHAVQLANPESMEVSATALAEDSSGGQYRLRIRCSVRPESHHGIVVGRVTSIKQVNDILRQDRQIEEARI
ncbi:MAG: hypothetical protein AAB817_01380 [Patescibacteria group bacterium]